MGQIGGAGNRVPDYQREIKELREEIRLIWANFARGPQSPPVQKHQMFSWSGAVSGSKLSAPWFAESDLTITGVTMGIAVTGGTTSATLLVNGNTIKTFTLAAGATRGGTTVRQSVAIGDRVQLSISGGGGTDLTCAVGYVSKQGW